ncbi:MAG: DUF1571 domain-containing protein [Candidatus Binatia bacterium]
MALRCWLIRFVCCALSFGIPRTGVADSFEQVVEVLLQCRAAYYRLEDYRGVLRRVVEEPGRESGRQEYIEVLFKKPGNLLMRWQSGLYKGTILRGELGGTQGKLTIRLGDGFEHIVAQVPATEVGEPFIPGLKDMSEWLTALFQLAQRPRTDRSLRLVELYQQTPELAEGRVLLVVPAFLIPFRDNSVATYEFVVERGTGIPMELILRGVGGEVRQRLTYTDLQVNLGMSLGPFEGQAPWSDSALDRMETHVDLRGFTQSWQRRYGEVEDYAGLWSYEVRQGTEDVVQRSDIRFKFRKPFDLYLQWETGTLQGQQALFRRGWNNGRVRIRTSWSGVPLIGDVSPDGYWARWSGEPQVTEFGLNRLTERLQEKLLRGWLRGELASQFLGVETFADRPCYVLEFRFPDEQVREYGTSRIVTHWDIEERVPVGFAAFDQAARLIERQTFRNLQFNISLRDVDFDAANPRYGFLLFRQAPEFDRFITGRD